MSEIVYQVISVIVIPFVVMGIRKVGLPTKFAPIAAFGIALALVTLGKLIGVELDVATLQATIITALATAGVSVLGYDAVTQLTEKK